MKNRAFLFGLAFTLLLLLSGPVFAQEGYIPGSTAQDGPGGLPWGKLPDGASTYSKDVDVLYVWIFWVVTVMFIVTEGLLIVFCVLYRRRPGHRTSYTHGNRAAEITWTIVPACILLAIAIVQIGTWNHIKKQFPDPGPGVTEVRALAQQFQWNIMYPKTKEKISGDNDAAATNLMHIPFGDKALVHIRSSDVIHSMFIPDMRVKQDLVPGIRQMIWFQPNRIKLIELKTPPTTKAGKIMKDLYESQPDGSIKHLKEGDERLIQSFIWVNDPAEFTKEPLKSKSIAVFGYDLKPETGLYGPRGTGAKTRILKNGALADGKWTDCDYCLGIFEIACAELCGLGHFKMRGQLVVEPRIAYDAWLASTADDALAEIWKKGRWKD